MGNVRATRKHDTQTVNEATDMARPRTLLGKISATEEPADGPQRHREGGDEGHDGDQQRVPPM